MPIYRAASTPGKSFIADSNQVSDKRKSELREWVPIGQALNDSQREAFIEKVCSEISIWDQTVNKVANAKMRSEIDRIRKASEQLNAAIDDFSQESFMCMRSRRDELVIVPNIGRQLPEHYLNEDRRRIRLEDDLAEIQTGLDMLIETASYAISMIPVSRQDKVDTRLSECLAYGIAACYLGVTGTTPPYSKNCWFLPFTQKALAIASPGLVVGEEKLREIILTLSPRPP